MRINLLDISVSKSFYFSLLKCSIHIYQEPWVLFLIEIADREFSSPLEKWFIRIQIGRKRWKWFIGKEKRHG